MTEPGTYGPLFVLAMLTDAFLSRHGCFPLDKVTPEQREWNQAMTLAYSLVGQPGSMMRTMAMRAAEKQGEDWTYLATCIEMHAEKFPVPEHMRNYAKKLREVGLEGAGARELATHLADIINQSTRVYMGVDLASADDVSVVTHESLPEDTLLFKVIQTDNFGREGPGHDDKWICEHAIPFVAAKALADALNQQYASETGDFWAAVVPVDYELQIFEP